MWWLVAGVLLLLVLLLLVCDGSGLSATGPPGGPVAG
jgi:hypothetical protein